MNRQNMEEEELEKSLGELEIELHDRYCQMGKSLMDIADSAGREIDKILGRIIDAKKKLTDIRQEISCEQCFTWNEAGNRYCKSCGAKLESPEERPHGKESQS